MDFRLLASKGRRVLVLANCQTGGLTASLSLFLPHDTVTGMSWEAGRGGPEAEVAHMAEVAEAARAADVIITSAPPEYRDWLMGDYGVDEKFLVVPSIFFAGFHPDLTIAYSDGKQVDGVLGTPYQSSIGVWCWKRGMSLDQARRLFTPETMIALGYDRSWNSAVERIRDEFQGSPVSVSDFFLPLQASGRPFMHTFNHPHISAIVQLARCAAKLLGADEADLRQVVEALVPDALGFGTIWPIYPGVGDSLGWPSNLLWKFGNSFYDLESYLDAQFRALDAVDGPVECHPSDDPDFGAVLRTASAR